MPEKVDAQREQPVLAIGVMMGWIERTGRETDMKGKGRRTREFGHNSSSHPSFNTSQFPLHLQFADIMASAVKHEASCIFCKIIKGEIPSFKLVETAHSYSFLDIQPTAKGHLLVIPKYHGAKLHNLPDEYLQDILPVVKKLTIALGLNVDGPEGTGYNVLQNNGRIAHQVVDHVHFHLIPKRDETTGLIVGWPAEDADMSELAAYAKELQAKLA